MVTAYESNAELIIDFGDGTSYTIPPLPGKHGIEALSMLVGVSMGVTLSEHGPERMLEDTNKLTRLVLGFDREDGEQREKEFEQMRAERQAVVAQAGLLWNVQGGSLAAVLDLIDEADGGFPKALGRVMQSCGLGTEYAQLQTWLDGESQAQNSETASTAATTTPPGTANTSDS